MLHLAIKEWGLRPFAFHIDCGWDLPETVENLKKLEQKLGVKIHNEVRDWEDMRGMQIIFLGLVLAWMFLKITLSLL